MDGPYLYCTFGCNNVSIVYITLLWQIVFLLEWCIYDIFDLTIFEHSYFMNSPPWFV